MSRVSDQLPGTKYVASVYKAVGSYVFGAAVSQSLTDVAKYSIGRLRPNFLAVCRPVWERVSCGGYVENFTCTGEPFEVDEARCEISKPTLPQVFFGGGVDFSRPDMSLRVFPDFPSSLDTHRSLCTACCFSP